MKNSRDKYEKNQRQDASRSRLEGLRQVKQQRSFVDEAQKEVLENDRVQAELTAHLREEREKYDKDLRHEMAQIKAEALKQNKAQRLLEEDSKKSVIENAKYQYEQLATARANRDSTEKAARKEMNRIKAESLRHAAAERRAKERAQQVMHALYLVCFLLISLCSVYKALCACHMCSVCVCVYCVYFLPCTPFFF
jgi:hypothetical protein